MDFSSVVMPDGSIVIMGGDQNTGTPANDAWRSTDRGATWTQVTPDAAYVPRGNGHDRVAMPDGSIVQIGPKNETWRSTDDGATWTLLSASNEWLVERIHFSSVALPDGSIVVMGGFAGQAGALHPLNLGRLNDVWRLETAGSSVQNPLHIYTKPGTYNVALQTNNADGYNSTQKTGYITVSMPDSAADITAFSLPGQVGSTTINSAAGTIRVIVPSGTDRSKLIPTFILPIGATAKVRLTTQVSGVIYRTISTPR